MSPKQSLTRARNAAKSRAYHDVCEIKLLLQRLNPETQEWDLSDEEKRELEQLRDYAGDLLQRIHDISAYQNAINTVAKRS